MTENDIARSDAPRPASSTEHGARPGAEPSTSLPRRREIHHPAVARPRRGVRRPALPAVLTAAALTAGLATGVAATANGSPDTAASAEATPRSGDGVAVVRTAAGGTTAAPQQVSDAQAALSRARAVANDSAALSDEQRDKIARKADRVRDLVTGATTQGADESTSAAAAGKASRSAERTPLPGRGQPEAETKGEAKSEAKSEAATDTEAAATADAAPRATAAAEPLARTIAQDGAEIAVGDAITHPTLLDDAVGTLADGAGQDGAGQDSAGEGGAGASGGGALAASPASSKKLASATESLTALIDRAQDSPVDIEAAPDSPAEILAAQAEAARQAAPGLAEHSDDTRTYENGRIPTDDLCELSFAPGETLRCDAAEQVERLNTAYKAQFGTNLSIRDSYRSYESQVSVKASRGYFAAVPGYSDHGLAVALDINGGVQEFGSAQYAWLRENGPAFGWDNPGWARADGRKPEAWHWEFVPRS